MGWDSRASDLFTYFSPSFRTRSCRCQQICPRPRRKVIGLGPSSRSESPKHLLKEPCREPGNHSEGRWTIFFRRSQFWLDRQINPYISPGDVDYVDEATLPPPRVQVACFLGWRVPFAFPFTITSKLLKSPSIQMMKKSG